MGLARLVRSRQRAAIDLAPGKDTFHADGFNINPFSGHFNINPFSAAQNPGPGPAPMYGGNAQESANDWNQYNNQARAQSTAAAPVANYDAANQSLGNAGNEIGAANDAMSAEGDAMALQKSAAEGNQPSAAQIQMGQGVSAGLRAQLAGAASARGGAYADAAAQQAASQANEQATAGAVGNSAELRAQEMANARSAYSGAAQGMQQGSVAASGALANIGQLQQQQGLSEAQLQEQQNALNVSGALGNDQLAQNIDTANLSAASGNQALQAQANQQNSGNTMSFIGGLWHAAGSALAPAGADIDLGGGTPKKYADAGFGPAYTIPMGGSATDPLAMQRSQPGTQVDSNGAVASLGPSAVAMPNDADAAKTAAWYTANGLTPPGGQPIVAPGAGPPGSTMAAPVPTPSTRTARGMLSDAMKSFGSSITGTPKEQGMTKAEMMAILGHSPQPGAAPPLNPPVAGVVKPPVQATGQVAPVSPPPATLGPQMPPRAAPPMPPPPQMPGPMAGGTPLMAQDMDLFSQGGFGSHGQEPNPNQPSLNAGPPAARGLARFAKRPEVMTSTGGIRAADADFQEPAKIDRPGGLAHWTLREEPKFIAAANQRTHELEKVVTKKLTPAEEKQVLGPHGAGPIFSDGPDRDRLEMNDMNMGASPGYGVMNAGGSMNPMGTLQQFSNAATAYGRRGGAAGPGAAVGQQFADGELKPKKDDWQQGYDQAVKHVTSNTDLLRQILSAQPPVNVPAPQGGFYVRGPEGYDYSAQPGQAADVNVVTNDPGRRMVAQPIAQPMPVGPIASYPDGDLGGFSAVTKTQYGRPGLKFADGPGTFDMREPPVFAVPRMDARAMPEQPGMLVSGNINLDDRPAVRNADGSVSSVRSIGVGVDGREVLIPTVIPDANGGRVVSNDEAIQQYRATGDNLGTFRSVPEANDYARFIHESQAAKSARPMLIDPGTYTPAPGIREPTEFGRIQSVRLPDVPSADDDNASVEERDTRWKPPPPTLQERKAAGLAGLAALKKSATKGLAPGSALLAAQREMAGAAPPVRVASR